MRIQYGHKVWQRRKHAVVHPLLQLGQLLLQLGEAFVALALAERTTGHVMTVDGGNIEAALR